METDEAPKERLISNKPVRIEPTELAAAFHDFDGQPRALVVELPSIGRVMPLWHSVDDARSALRQLDADPNEYDFVWVRRADGVVRFARQNQLTIIVDLKLVDDDTWQYGKVVWD